MEDTIFLQSESKPTTKAEPKKEVKAEKKDYTKMNVYQKLAIARAELGNRPLKKSGFNKFSGFSYFELSDFIAEITKIFKDLNLVSVFKIKPNDLGIETAYMDIINADNPNDIVSFEASTAEAAVKGASTIQILGAKHTYMRRYLWLEAMEIAENDAQDAQDKSKDEKPATQKQLALASLGQVKILSAQDPERIKKMLDYYGVKDAIELPEAVRFALQKLKEFQITKQEMDNQEKEIKQAIQKAMEENGIKGFENDDVKISYVAPTQRVSVDTAKMKEEGIYDLYTKTSEVKASVRLTYK